MATWAPGYCRRSGKPADYLAGASLTDFYYPHAWASAHFATIAHSFATHGIIRPSRHTHREFRPPKTQPDNYLHWPPFFFYVLSLVLRAFPQSIRAMHFFMAVIAIANAYVMWLIASMSSSPGGNPLRQRLPADARHARYGLVLLPANLGMPGVSVALLFMLVTCKALMPDAKGRWTSDQCARVFFLLALPRGSRFWRCPDCCSRTASIADRNLEDMLVLGNRSNRGGREHVSHLFLSEPTFLGDLWSIFTFRLGLTQYLALSTWFTPSKGNWKR